MPSPFEEKFYKGHDLLNMIEDGFYNDFDPKDYQIVKSTYKTLGDRECLESLSDYAGADFNVMEVKGEQKYMKMEIEGNFKIASLDDGIMI